MFTTIQTPEDLQTRRPISLRAWIVAVACLCAAAGAVCSWLMWDARRQAAESMANLCSQARGRKPESVLTSKIFYPNAANTLKPFLSGFGLVKSATYKIAACQVSGRPCIVQWGLTSRTSTASMMLYFYGRECREVEELSRTNAAKAASGSKRGGVTNLEVAK